MSGYSEWSNLKSFFSMFDMPNILGLPWEVSKAAAPITATLCLATALFRTPRHIFLLTAASSTTSQRLTLPPGCILHNLTAQEPTNESCRHSARSPVVTSPVNPRRRTPATNQRPTRRGPGLAPSTTWPQRLRRWTPAANHRRTRLTPPKVRPRRRRHAARSPTRRYRSAAVSGNTYCPDTSTDMQYDLLGSQFDLDLRSNIEADLWRSIYICFDLP